MAEKKIIELEVKTNMKGVNLDMKEVVKQTKDAKTATKEFNDVAADTSKKTGGFKAIKDSVTSLVPGFKSAEGGVNSFSSSLKMLLANPIVLLITAIVGGLTLLFKAFTSTKDGADKFAQVMKGVSAIIDVVRDRILNVGNAIVKFFSGDFKGALAEGKKAVSGFGEEVTREFKAAANATRDLQKVEDAFNRLSVSRAKVNRDLAISKELLTDENASFEEKRKALEKIKKTEGEQTAQELKNARKKYESIVALNALSDTSRENKKKEQDAMVALIALEEQSARDRRAINKQEKTLNNQEKQAKKEAYDAEKARAKERADAEKVRLKERQDAEKARLKEEQETEQAANQAKINARNNALNEIEQAENDAYNSKLTRDQLEIQNVNDKYFKLIELAKEYGESTVVLEQAQADEIAKIQKDTADKKAQLDKEVAEKAEALRIENEAKETARIEKEKSREKELRDKKIQMGQQAFGALADLSALFANGNEAEQRKAFQISKAANLGLAIMNTANAVTGALAEPSIVPGERFFKAALAGATGGINIAKIAATQFQATGDTSTGATPTASAPRTPSFDIIQAQPQMQLGALQQQPVKAYVVSGEVSTAQALDRNRVRNATF